MGRDEAKDRSQLCTALGPTKAEAPESPNQLLGPAKVINTYAKEESLLFKPNSSLGNMRGAP